MFLICAENYKRIKVHENGFTEKDERYIISALKRDGEFIKKDFIGFIEKTSLFRPQYVKIVNIVGVYNDIEIIDIPRGHWVLGVYHAQAFSVVLEDNQPLYHPIEHEKHIQRYHDNVVSLSAFSER
ncbi:hypothetical protein [Vibrio splendidus]|uniref:hypothetical protein n=1 Tax=Vibrio splendidus TaxID=29497 RepID=UPI000C85E2CE|nr:hypothetical protein [Vibrio splendidus]PMK15877.1 hypothetical protein BCU10_13875 [Vibrio splendidus]